jgi:hypothetical protein
MERFSLKKLNELEGKEQFSFEVSNEFAVLEDLDAEVESNSAWETIRENIKISTKMSLGYFELKKHKPWFDGGCSKLLDQRKQAKLKWLQVPSEINWDNLNNVRREARRYFKKKETEYLKDKINELAANSKNKNIREMYRGINEFKSGHHRFINSVWNKEELPDQWKKSLIVPIHRNSYKIIVVIIVGYHYYQLHTFYRISSSEG